MQLNIDETIKNIENVERHEYSKAEKLKFVSTCLALFGMASLFSGCLRQQENKNKEPFNITITVNNRGTININDFGDILKLFGPQKEEKVVVIDPLKREKSEKEKYKTTVTEKQKSNPKGDEREKYNPADAEKQKDAKPNYDYKFNNTEKENEFNVSWHEKHCKCRPPIDKNFVRSEGPHRKYGDNYSSALRLMEYLIGTSCVKDYTDDYSKPCWIQAKDWTVRHIDDNIRIYKANRNGTRGDKDVVVKIYAPYGKISGDERDFLTRSLMPKISYSAQISRERKLDAIMDRILAKNDPNYIEKMWIYGQIRYDIQHDGCDWIIKFQSYELMQYYNNDQAKHDFYYSTMKRERTYLDPKDDLDLAP